MTPAEQLRVGLARARAAGVAFDEAWPAAMANALALCPRARGWAAALRWARPAFAAGYARASAKVAPVFTCPASVPLRASASRVWSASSAIFGV